MTGPASECFCGCGRRPEGSAQLSSNVIGWEMNEQIAELMNHSVLLDVMVPDRDMTNQENFLADGREYWLALRDESHGEALPSRDTAKSAKRWVKFSRQMWKKSPGHSLMGAVDFPPSSVSEISAWLLDGTKPGWADEVEDIVRSADEQEESGTTPPVRPGRTPGGPEISGRDDVINDGREEAMTEDEGLGAYLKHVSPRAEGATGETAQRIETLFEELNLPWSREEDVWEIRADVGFVYAALSEDSKLLTFWQSIHPLDGPPKKKADYLASLLHINMATRGACFALDDTPPGSEANPYVTIIARIAAQKIDKEEIEASLGGLFRMSALYDRET